MNARVVAAVVVLAVALSAGFASSGSTQKPGTDDKDEDKQAQMFFNSVKSLPGCLGGQMAEFEDNQHVIFLWYKDKKAVMNWIRDPMHQRAMNSGFPNRKKRPALEHIGDDVGPILVIFSVTTPDKKTDKPKRGPPPQIAMELYAPLPGGMAKGGRFAPAALEIPGLRTYDAQGLVAPDGANRPKTEPARASKDESPSSPSLAILARGSRLYHGNHCRKCHFSSAIGGPRAPSLADDKWLHCDGSIDGMKKVILAGVAKSAFKNQSRPDAMPAASQMGLSEADVEAIAAYLWMLGRERPESP